MPTFDDYAPYRALVDSGHYTQSIHGGLDLLALAKQLAIQQFQTAHKGTPFYIMGYAAFASHDYPTASLFFDAAAAEDLRNYPGRLDQPSLLFMELDNTRGDVLARDIVKAIREIVQKLIKDYNSRKGSQATTINDLQKFFLRPIIHSGQPHQRALVTAFISFVAEWQYRALLIDIVEHGSREPFFLHLFRGCLLFESLLKSQTKKTLTYDTLGKILQYDLLSELGLTSINVGTGGNDFNTIVAGLSSSMDIEPTINSVGQSRNTLGHNIVWTATDLTKDTYEILVKNIAAACLHAITKLYS
jgi:hypothetical protein